MSSGIGVHSESPGLSITSSYRDWPMDGLWQPPPNLMWHVLTSRVLTKTLEPVVEILREMGGEDGNIMVEYIVYEENYKTRYIAKHWTMYHICCHSDEQDVS